MPKRPVPQFIKALVLPRGIERIECLPLRHAEVANDLKNHFKHPISPNLLPYVKKIANLVNLKIYLLIFSLVFTPAKLLRCIQMQGDLK